MNPKAVLAAILLAATAATGAAFSIDAVGYHGDVLDALPTALAVPGYGEIQLHSFASSTLVVESAYQTAGRGTSLPPFRPEHALPVRLREPGAGTPNSPPDADSVGLSGTSGAIADEASGDDPAPAARDFEVPAHDPARPAARRWAAIPEPAAALLGLLGTLLLMFGRRRR